MKAIFTLLLAILFSAAVYSQGTEYDTLLHKDTYKGKDLLVKNYMDSRNGYSVKEVILNDKVLRDPTNNNTFNVMLTKSGLRNGDEYTLKIVYYKSGQAPKILSD